MIVEMHWPTVMSYNVDHSVKGPDEHPVVF